MPRILLSLIAGVLALGLVVWAPTPARAAGPGPAGASLPDPLAKAGDGHRGQGHERNKKNKAGGEEEDPPVEEVAPALPAPPPLLLPPPPLPLPRPAPVTPPAVRQPPLISRPAAPSDPDPSGAEAAPEAPAPSPPGNPAAAPPDLPAAQGWPAHAEAGPSTSGPGAPELAPDLMELDAVPRRVVVTLVSLPLLLGVWLLVLLRLGTAFRQMRSAPTRRLVAAELGVAPGQLAALDLGGLSRLRDQIAFDELTGVMRRAAGLAAVEREVARAHRGGQPLTLAFVDVDGLKRVNDSHGHAAGDELLKDVAGVLTARLRAQDVVLRYGGDEFVCALPATGLAAAEATLSEALSLARLRQRTFSVGLAELRPAETPAELLQRADSELYRRRAERRGRRQ